MKSISIILLAIFSLSGFAQNITGKVISPKRNHVVLRSYTHDLLNLKPNNFAYHILDNDNAFKSKIASPLPYYAFLQTHNNEEAVRLYFEKDFELDMTIEYIGDDQSIYFKGKGSVENDYLFQLHNVEQLLNTQHLNPYSFDEQNFVAWVADYKLRLLKTFNTYFDDKAINKSFYRLEKEYINYVSNQFLMVYPQRRTTKNAPLSSNYWEFLKGVNLSDSLYLHHPLYLNFLLDVTVQEANLKTKKGRINDKATYYNFLFDYITENSTGELQQQLLAKLMNPIVNYAIKTNWEKTLSEKYTNDIDTLTGLPYKKFVEFTLIKDHTYGTPAYNFTYPDVTGKNCNLYDLTGNLIYVDLWVTWCPPCRYEIPSSKTLQNKYANQKIKFVNICFDADTLKWKGFVRKLNWPGLHLNPRLKQEERSDFHAAYHMNGVPRYLLIDENLNVISTNTLYPSSPQIERMFDHYLYSPKRAF